MSLSQLSASRMLRILLPFTLALALTACKSTHVRTTTDFATKVDLTGKKIVMVEPSIQLYEMQASGANFPKADWTRAARKHFPAAVTEFLKKKNAALVADYYPPSDMPSNHRIRQVIALNEAVTQTIQTHSYFHVPLPTRGTARRKPLSWTVGPGVQEIKKITNADYMLTIFIQDTYATKGRIAMMLLGVAFQVALLEGASQGGRATLVDLNTGEVVWFNIMSDQLGDLRSEEGATVTARRLLKGLPL